MISSKKLLIEIIRVAEKDDALSKESSCKMMESLFSGCFDYEKAVTLILAYNTSKFLKDC